mgnify:CR=1 FL=1
MGRAGFLNSWDWRWSRRRLAGPRISTSSFRPKEEGCPRAGCAGPPASPPGAGGRGGRSASGPRHLVGSPADVPGSSSGLRLAPGRPAPARRAATGVSMGTCASASSKAASSSGSNAGAHVERALSTLLTCARPELHASGPAVSTPTPRSPTSMAPEVRRRRGRRCFQRQLRSSVQSHDAAKSRPKDFGGGSVSDCLPVRLAFPAYSGVT